MTVVEDRQGPSSNHMGELTLRRYRAAELGGPTCAEVDQHLAGCPVCRSKLRVLVEEERAFQREISFERFAGGVERAQRVPRQHPRRALAWSISGIVAAAAMALFLVQVSSSTRNRSKGAGVEATARIASTNASAQRVAPPGSHEVLEPGDRVRLGYKTADARYLAAVSIDDGGAITPLYPEDGSALPVSPTQETVYLPDSLEFTGAGKERVFLFMARKPFAVDAAKEAVRAAHQVVKGDLELLPNPAFAGGQDVFSWLFRKP
jgi:hypothetical protein